MKSRGTVPLQRAKIMSLNEHKLRLKAEKESEDFESLKPYFEAFFSAEGHPETFHESLPASTLPFVVEGKIQHCGITVRDIEVWPDYLRAIVRIEKPAEDFVEPTLFTKIVLQEFMNTAFLLGLSESGVGFDFQANKKAPLYIPIKNFVQERIVELENMPLCLQIWIIRHDSSGYVKWAGSLGESYFIYSEGHLAADTTSKGH